MPLQQVACLLFGCCIFANRTPLTWCQLIPWWLHRTARQGRLSQEHVQRPGHHLCCTQWLPRRRRSAVAGGDGDGTGAGGTLVVQAPAPAAHRGDDATASASDST